MNCKRVTFPYCVFLGLYFYLLYRCLDCRIGKHNIFNWYKAVTSTIYYSLAAGSRIGIFENNTGARTSLPVNGRLPLIGAAVPL